MTTWLDELRVVKGQAVWTVSFTPLSSPYVAIPGDVVAFTGIVTDRLGTLAVTEAADVVAFTGTVASGVTTLSAAAGSYNLTGSPAGLVTVTNIVLPADAGSYAITGSAAGLQIRLTAGTGSYNVTGATAALARGLTASAGSYTLTGANAALARGLVAGAGSYTLTGSPAGLTVTANFVLPAAAGAYTLTGQAAAFVTGGATVLAVSPGAYTITGAPAALTVGSTSVLAAAAGSYTLTGLAAALKRGFTEGAGAYTITGSTANFVTSGNVRLTAAAGAYALTGGSAANFVFTTISAKLVTSFTPGPNRNDYTILVGMEFVLTVNTPFNGIGLRCGLNNTGLHTVGLYDRATSTLLRSANIDLTGKTEGTFYYGDITPITLVAGTTYSVLASVTAGDGQMWSEVGATTLKDAQPGSVFACYSLPPGAPITTTGFADQQYAGVDLSYGVTVAEVPRPVGGGPVYVDYGREKRRKTRGLRQAEKFFEMVKADAEQRRQVIAQKAETQESPPLAGETDRLDEAEALAQQQRQQQVIDNMLAQAAARVAQARAELAQIEALGRAMEMDEEDAITVLLLQ